MGEGQERPFPAVELGADAEHCLETAARREYQRLMGAFLRGELEEVEAEAGIELLREFLERADFAALRRACEGRLRKGMDTVLLLYREGEELRYGFVDEAGEAGARREE
ncbi:hypothetical protein [Candidatus Solincola tengchongensis]|uniref:hypothetical protein n=1 Tax=Candidatus Solincola tengchongensis TaxID=2900693 RepID=UPI00257CCF99|nr:hypothetical protein [Candidatus Solincola tengchongensis]